MCGRGSASAFAAERERKIASASVREKAWKRLNIYGADVRYDDDTALRD